MLQTVKGKPRNLKEVLEGQQGEGFPGEEKRFTSILIAEYICILVADRLQA